jgi:hypothetical protein
MDAISISQWATGAAAHATFRHVLMASLVGLHQVEQYMLVAVTGIGRIYPHVEHNLPLSVSVNR